MVSPGPYADFMYRGDEYPKTGCVKFDAPKNKDRKHISAHNMTQANINITNKRKTVSDAAADEIRVRILGGDLAEGAQLRQDMLAAEFGVSRIPIREALMQLESEGFVQIVPHRGAVVSSLSVIGIEELVQLRAMLEPHLLRLSAPNLTDADYQHTEELLEKYQFALKDMNVSAWGELNRSLHFHLYSRANQQRTQKIVESLLQQNDRYARLHLSLTHELEKAQNEHELIVKLCREKHINAACSVLEAHIREAGTGLIQTIKDRMSSPAE